MPKIAVILIGHFRSFDRVYKSFLKELESVAHDFYLHTWSTQNATTKSWHDILEKPQNLTSEQISLLKSLDSNVEIETQTFTLKELKDCINKKPKKAIVYLFQALQKCLKRIKDPSQYDYILVSRYDVDVINKLCLSQLKIRPNEICLGWRLGLGYIDSLIAHDIIYAFSSSLSNIKKFDFDFSKFLNDNVENLKIAEEIYTIFFRDNFQFVSREWEYGSEFCIVR